MGDVLLIDNIDSFTYNIADLLHRVLGRPPTVWRHDHVVDDGALAEFAAIIVGPGPGRPQRATDMGLSDLALRQRDVPVLGICLGHQGMAHLAGDAVVEMAHPVHGIVSEITHDGSGLFAGVPSPFRAVRYHSLQVLLAGSSPLRVSARSLDDGAVMGLADGSGRRWGLQFHPESVLSEHGAQLLANFLSMSGVAHADPARWGMGRVGAVDEQAVAVGDVHRHGAVSEAAPEGVRVRGSAPRRAGAGRAVQLAAVQVGGAVDTAQLHAELLGQSPTAFWLDASTSALGGASGAPPLPPTVRCSVMGDASGPLSYVLTHRVGVGSQLSTGEQLSGPLLANLAELRDRLQMTGDGLAWTAFRPGFVGYLGYELKAETGGLAAHVSPFPDARLVLADRAVLIDHERDVVHAVYLWDSEIRQEQETWVERVREAVRAVTAGPAARGGGRADSAHGGSGAGADGTTDVLEMSLEGLSELALRHTRADYLDLIAQCQQEIRAGESYEICLTNTAAWPGVVDEQRLYRQLREASPVPYGAWLRGPGWGQSRLSVLSASPERFVSVSAQGLVQARPIKGTRARGTDSATDQALAQDLQSSVKDRAENLMIVDLLRNDLHRVCSSGSVHVPQIFEVESYATVHQLVSTVEGQLVHGMDALDVIGTCFPGGSMTGAPKVRTMEILDRLEGGPRGVYSGALGWIGLDGAMDLSIVIRTVTWADGVCEFGVGGAITALSDPNEEYAETLVKARAIHSALQRAGAARGRVTE